jgi:hypothetical protein
MGGRMRGIIVLGMHRSGTSLVANLLHSWGAYGGDKDILAQADESNQQGYWEHSPLVEFNQELLKSISADWFIPPDGTSQKVLETRHSVPAYRCKAQQLIDAMQERNIHWMWKDPRLALLLPFWKQIWGDVLYVIVIRHPFETAISLKKRNFFPISASLLLWQLYMLAILRNTENSATKIFIRYDHLIHNPIDYCQYLSSSLEQFCEMPGNRDKVIEEMTKVINPALWHNQSNSHFDDLPQATPDQKALYSFLLKKAEAPDAFFDESRFACYTGWKDYLHALDTLSNLWAQIRHKDYISRSDITLKNRELFFL